MMTVTMNAGFTNAAEFGIDFAQARKGWISAAGSVAWTAGVAVRVAAAAVPFMAVCAIFSAV